MSRNKKTIIRDEVVTEIKKKASEDKDFKKMLFDNPREALEKIGVIMPADSSENYLGSIYSAYGVLCIVLQVNLERTPEFYHREERPL